MTPAPSPGRRERPYAATGGRTRAPGGAIGFDTQITAQPHRVGGRPLSGQHRAVLEACATPCAVAEIAARLNLPVGVVTVLLDQLHHARLIRARTPHDMASESNVTHALLQRVRAALIKSRDDEEEQGERRAN